MTRILIIDDHPFIREGVKRILSGKPDMTVTGEAGNGPSALDLIESEHFDLVILDLTLPEMSGLETLERIKAGHPKLPVLILSIHTEEEYVRQVLELGASGFVPKDSLPEILVTAIRRILAGGRYLTSDLAEALAFSGQSGLSMSKDLSRRELQVLKLLGVGRSYKEIAGTLHIGIKTISSYRMRIFQKMGFRTNADLVRYAVENHLLLEPED